jgi:hypothetical protein
MPAGLLWRDGPADKPTKGRAVWRARSCNCVQWPETGEAFMATCARCGGDSFSAGAMISAVRTSFRPQDSKFLTLETGDVMTKAMMCRSCGVIEIIGDVNKLKRLTSEPDAKTERFVAGKTDAEPERFPKAINE